MLWQWDSLFFFLGYTLYFMIFQVRIPGFEDPVTGQRNGISLITVYC
jgi:hypothetical protein